jgi:hypothetical protein
MADYYQVKNQNIFNPPANTSLGNATNQFNDVYVQNDLVLGNVVVTGSTIITPKISTITYPGDDTAADPAGGQTITLTGSGFLAGATVLINNFEASVVSVVSSTTITFTSPANSTGSYVLYVINTDGGTAIAIPGIQYSGTPTWSTAAGSLGNVYETANFNSTVTATGDAPITYSVFSGSIPPGATFNSNGTITGTSQVLSSPTTYTFTVRATDAELQDTNRTFSLTINPDVVTWNNPANNTTYTQSTNVAISNVTLSATSAVGSGITYTANSLPDGLSLTGANISGTPTVAANSSSLLTATANTTSESSAITINWVISVANDIYFEYNTLLIPGASTTFVDDASTNNFAITINGDTRPNSLNPYTPGYYSNYFDGSGDYLSIPSTTALQFGTGDFTVESWVYLTATPSAQYAQIIGRTEYGTNADWMLQITNATKLTFYLGTSLAFIVTSTNSISLNTWTHVAVSRSGSSVKLFINGVVDGTTTNAGSTEATASGAYTIGADQAGDEVLLTGYLSNIRAVKGTAVYTSNFTPSTTPLTAIANTSLLTCQSNRFIDNSTNNFTITVAGNTTVNSFDPFVPNSSYSTYGSGYFDGTGDYLTAPSNAAFDFGTGDFTLEAWCYRTGSGAYGFIISRRAADANYGPFSLGITGLNAPYFSCSSSGSSWLFQITSGTTISLNTWAHIAGVRNGSTFTLYLNGVSVGTATSSSSLMASSVTPAIGAHANGSEPFAGYITDARIVKGTAVYTTAFTPPSAPLTAIANTSLLTLQNNQSVNNNIFLDNSTNNFFVTRFGNSTQGTFSPYGGNWSNYFDGNGDYLTVPDNAALEPGSSNLTWEMWINTTNSTQYATLYSRSPASFQVGMWSLLMNIASSTTGDVGLYVFDYSNSTPLLQTSGVSVRDGLWHHIAVVRNGSAWNLYVDGVTRASASWSGTIADIVGNVYIGQDQFYTRTYTGYISNFRVIKGTAVYTSNFTPSTTPLTPITNTSLLTCADNRLVDDSINNFTITKNGDVSVQRFSPFNPSTLTATSYSGYFDGTGDYLRVPYNAGFAMGSSNFTIEYWVYPTALTGDITVLGAHTNDTNGGYGVGFNGTQPRTWVNIGGGGANWYQVFGSTVSLNTWNHIAFVRNGSSFYMYTNGVQGTVYTNANAITNASNSDVTIGARYDGTGNFYTGYVSNARIVKGTALYTSTFTPPTTPLTTTSQGATASQVSLLTCQSSTFIDNSTNNFTISAFGNSQPTPQNPFGFTSATTEGYTTSTIGGSGYFDGTGDYLTVPSNSIFQITGNVTIEAYVYATSINTFQNILSQYLNSTNAFACGYNSTSGWYFNYRNNTTEVTNYRAGTSPLNAWTHVAFVKSSTTMTVYINGTALASTITVPDLPQFAAPLYISLWAGASDSPWVGYISDLRMVKTAVYTSNFVPPAAPLNAIQNTALLNNMIGAGISDASMMNNMETVADAKLSTAISKFGGSSVYFDGTGDYLSMPATVTNRINTTGNFTIEFWAYFNTVAADQRLIAWDNNSSNFVIAIYTSSSGVLSYYLSSTGTSWNIAQQISMGNISATTWTHVALVRNGSTFTPYINGVAGTTTTSSATLTTSTLPFVIGAVGNGSSPFNGYIDDFRMTRGYARYTSNFTPPTTAFPIY